MEVAGLVLTVVSLFGSCLKGYQLISEIKNGGQDSAILFCRLQIEEKRLMIWGRTVGLAEDTCRIPLQDLDTILAVLTEIHSITQDAAVMKKRYGATGSTEPLTYVRDQGPIEYIPSTQVYEDFRRKIDERIRSPGQSLKTGLRWVFEKKNFEKLVVDLRELNNGLYALLEGVSKLSSTSRFNEICLMSSASEDKQSLAVIRDASKTSYEELCRTVDQRIHAFDLKDSPPIGSDRTATQIPLEELKWIKPEAQRSIARFEDEVVLVEWRGYGHEDLDDEQVLGVLSERIAELSILLGRNPKPEGFRVMDCIGYCHDMAKQRFGLIYNLPALEIDEAPEIVSLYDLFQPQKSGDVVFPSLNDRFLLSHVLANSILQLHTTRWLHRNLRSLHILFIKSGKNMDWLQYPYLSGFVYSRVDNPDVVSLPLRAQDEEAAYQHPDLAENTRIGYRREYDAYSLAIVLIEIGFWRPILKFRKPEYSAKRNHRRLLEYQLTGDLAHRMGHQFEQAVKLLLTGQAYGSSKIEGEQLITFSRDVVSRLDAQSL